MMRPAPVHLLQEMAMSVSAYVLIQTEVGRAATVARTVQGVEGVVTADLFVQRGGPGLAKSSEHSHAVSRPPDHCPTVRGPSPRDYPA